MSLFKYCFGELSIKDQRKIRKNLNEIIKVINKGSAVCLNEISELEVK